MGKRTKDSASFLKFLKGFRGLLSSECLHRDVETLRRRVPETIELLGKSVYSRTSNCNFTILSMLSLYSAVYFSTSNFAEFPRRLFLANAAAVRPSCDSPGPSLAARSADPKSRRSNSKHRLRPEQLLQPKEALYCTQGFAIV